MLFGSKCQVKIVAVTFVITEYVSFYDTSALLITFILLGRTLESIAKGRTSKAIRSIMDLQAKIAIVVRNGEEITIPAEDVEVGDIVLIKPGEKAYVVVPPKQETKTNDEPETKMSAPNL